MVKRVCGRVSERYKARVVDVGDMSLVHGHGGQAETDNTVHSDEHTDASPADDSEKGVTATELIIEMMVLAMSTEQDDENAPGATRLPRRHLHAADAADTAAGAPLTHCRCPSARQPTQPLQSVALLHHGPAGRRRVAHHRLHCCRAHRRTHTVRHPARHTGAVHVHLSQADRCTTPQPNWPRRRHHRPLHRVPAYQVCAI